MKKLFRPYKYGLLATKTGIDANGEEFVTEWKKIKYNDKEIGRKYNLIERKNNDLNRLEKIK